MLIELHSHTDRHSGCSLITPETLVRRAVQRGLQGIVLTEHHYLWTADEITRLREKLDIDEAFLIMAGQEVETAIGHVLVFGVGETIADRVELAELRARFPQAALVWAHPFRNGREPGRKELMNPLLDGIEIISMNHSTKENYRGLMSWHRHKFTAVSGSDTHSLEMAAMYPTLFDHRVDNISVLAAEIKAGRCRPLFKKIPANGSNTRVTRITIGSKGDDETRSAVVVKEFSSSHTWKRVKRMLQVVEALRRDGFAGGVYRVPRVIDVNDGDRVLIEEQQRGRTLHELLPLINPRVGIGYFRMTARWLARFHRLKLQATTPDRTVRKERKRFGAYLRSFQNTGNPRADEARRIIDFVREREEHIFAAAKYRFIQVHGDFHPKNVIVGQDRSHDISTLFVSVVDFDSTMFFVPAFDVGYFLAQFMYQFRHERHLLAMYCRPAFLYAYRELAGRAEKDWFSREVTLFELRANMSIAAYLIKVGKGESEDMDWLMDRSLKLLEKLRNEG